MARGVSVSSSVSNKDDDTDDRELIERLRQGDRQAAETLYLRYYDRLIAFAYAYVRSRPIAEEIVQDTFLALWERRSTVEIRENIRVYLYAAVRNRALHFSDHARVVERTEHQAVRDEVMLGSGSAAMAPDVQFETAELEAAVERAIAALPDRRRIALTLRWKHQLSYSEIAEIMGSSVGAVTIQVARAREAITALIARYTD